MTHARPNRARSRRGFTLIELMIAMSIGLMVVGSAYYISRTTGRMFSEQLRRAETQMGLRSAVEMIRRDAARAGFGGLRGTAEMPGCNNSATNAVGNIGNAATDLSPVPLFAVMVDRDANAQRLWLTGNFATSERYIPNSAASTTTDIVLDTTHDTYRRSFVNPADGTFLTARFSNVFAAQTGMIAFQDLLSRKVFLRQVLGVVPNGGTDPTIQLATPLPSNSGCNWNPGAALVAPLSTVRYEIVGSNDPTLRIAAGATHMGGGIRFMLVRREIDMSTLANPGTAQVIAGTDRIVADFVDPLRFRIEAVQDTAVPGAQPALQRTTAPEGVLGHTLRSLTIDLYTTGAGQGTKGVIDEARAASGGRFLRFDVFLPNLARNPTASLGGS